MRRKVFLPCKILIRMWWSLRPILVLWLAAEINQINPLVNPEFTWFSEQSNLSSLHFWVWICAVFPFLLSTPFSRRQELYIWCFWAVQTFCGSPAWTEGKQQKTIRNLMQWCQCRFHYLTAWVEGRVVEKALFNRLYGYKKYTNRFTAHHTSCCAIIVFKNMRNAWNRCLKKGQKPLDCISRPAFPRHCWGECLKKWVVLQVHHCCSSLCSCCREFPPGSLSSTSARSWSCRPHSMVSNPAASLTTGMRPREPQHLH